MAAKGWILCIVLRFTCVFVGCEGLGTTMETIVTGLSQKLGLPTDRCTLRIRLVTSVTVTPQQCQPPTHRNQLVPLVKGLQVQHPEECVVSYHVLRKWHVVHGFVSARLSELGPYRATPATGSSGSSQTVTPPPVSQPVGIEFHPRLYMGEAMLDQEVTLDDVEQGVRQRLCWYHNPETAEPEAPVTEYQAHVDAVVWLLLVKVAGVNPEPTDLWEGEQKLLLRRLEQDAKLCERVARKQLAPVSESSGVWHVPWERVLALVAQRQVTLVNGWALVRRDLWPSLYETWARSLTQPSVWWQTYRIDTLPWYEPCDGMVRGLYRSWCGLAQTDTRTGFTGVDPQTDPPCWVKWQTPGPVPRLKFDQRRLMGQLYAQQEISVEDWQKIWRPRFRQWYGDPRALREEKSVFSYWRNQRKRRVRAPTCVAMVRQGLCPVALEAGQTRPVITCVRHRLRVPDHVPADPISVVIHRRQNRD